MRIRNLPWMTCLLAIIGFTVPFHTSQACLNGYHEVFTQLEQGSLASYPFPMGHPLDTAGHLMATRKSQWVRGLQNGDYEDATDYGLYLIYAHRYAEAETHLRAVQARWPDEYAAVANLGTVLELTGKTEEALRWIRRAVLLDSNAHHGSEWIHIRILERKCGINAGAPLLAEVNMGNGAAPVWEKTRREASQLQMQLFYQLNERLTFIPPPEPLVGELLYALANVCCVLNDADEAWKAYRRARAFGFSPELLPRRLHHARKLRRA